MSNDRTTRKSNPNRTPITQHQPEVVDLTASDDELDTHTSVYHGVTANEVESSYFISARRYGWYRERYLELFERFFCDVCEFHMSTLDGTHHGSFAEDQANLVDSFIWKLMDRDLQE